MNEWMNEWMNGWMNGEWVNEGNSERVFVCIVYYENLNLSIFNLSLFHTIYSIYTSVRK